MPPRRGTLGSAATTAALVLALVVVAGTPLLLHVTQKRHDVLHLDLDAQFPPGTPLVGGEVLAGTIEALVDHELTGGTGWRPNDFVLWGPGLWADNNANRQLGIILAVRETVRVFKDHLTKVSSDQYDQNLVAADTAFRNDMERLWLPSAESKLREGVRHLQAYGAGLHDTPPTSRPVNRRNVELIRLFQTWGDLLGDTHAQLYRTDLPWLRVDDAYYHSQGVAYALGHLVPAIGREYREDFAVRPVLTTLVDEVTAALSTAGRLKPIVVLDGRPAGIFANHRRNLDAYVTEARQKMYSIREELEK